MYTSIFNRLRAMTRPTVSWVVAMIAIGPTHATIYLSRAMNSDALAWNSHILVCVDIGLINGIIKNLEIIVV